uniref:Uncharacterized protein n=1 Tax=Mesocestoides corti TaxID=53468 RepID=A0A5K3FMG4_MESCO
MCVDAGKRECVPARKHADCTNFPFTHVRTHARTHHRFDLRLPTCQSTTSALRTRFTPPPPPSPPSPPSTASMTASCQLRNANVGDSTDCQR